MLKIIFPSNLSEIVLLELHNIFLWKIWKQKLEYKLKRAIRIDFDRYIYYHLVNIDSRIGQILIEEACLFGKINIILLIIDHIEKIHGKISYNTGLLNACEGGYLDIVNLMINKGANNWVDAIEAVCIGGSKVNNIGRYLIRGTDQFVEHSNKDRLQIVKMMLEKNKISKNSCNTEVYRYNKTIYNACISGDLSIIDLIRREITSSYYFFSSYHVVFGACRGGHLSLVKQMENETLGWINHIEQACQYNHSEIIEYIVEKNEKIDLTDGLYGFCRGGNFEMIKYLMKQDKTFTCGGFIHACHYGHFNIVKFLVKEIKEFDLTLPAIYRVTWNEGLKCAIIGKNHFETCMDRYHTFGTGHMSIIKLMINNGVTDLNTPLFEACKGDDIDLVKYLIDEGADDFRGGLCSACFANNFELVKLIVEKDSTFIRNALNSLKERSMDNDNYVDAKIIQYLESQINN